MHRGDPQTFRSLHILQLPFARNKVDCAACYQPNVSRKNAERFRQIVRVTSLPSFM
jgi:hypothetical protein